MSIPLLRSGPATATELREWYAVSAPAWVRANFVSTLDGRVTGSDGRSGSINSEADHAVFATLRALADVVVVGAGTARAEGYGPLTRPLVLTTRTGWVPETVLAGATAATGGAAPVQVAVCERTPTEAVAALRRRLGADAVVVAGAEQVQASVLLEHLHAQGWRRVLTEGGPSLLADWLQGGVVDELCLTVRPLLLGGAGPHLVQDQLEGVAARPTHVLAWADDLFLRYRLTRGSR